MKLDITTLGSFDIRYNNTSLMEETSRSYRILKLFQYFLTFKNKRLLPESIIENLWQDSLSTDPKNMLRAQIFRLRQTIKNILPEGEDESDYLSINFNNGYYILETGPMLRLDVDVFEDLIVQGDRLAAGDAKRAIEIYREALDLYKGLYIEENPYEMWIVPIRSYYSRVYLKTLYRTLELLEEGNRDEEIIDLCEGAIHIEPYEEGIHISMMEAMLRLGQIIKARSHYDNIVLLFEREMKNTDSLAMKNIYRKIESSFSEKGEIDLNNMDRKLSLEGREGPLYCDSDYFKIILDFQQKKRKLEEGRDYIGLISLDCKHCREEDYNLWKERMISLLRRNLRKGDVFTFWNDSQILIILVDVKDQGILAIEKRIKNGIENNMDFQVRMNYKLIDSTDNYMIESPV